MADEPSGDKADSESDRKSRSWLRDHLIVAAVSSVGAIVVAIIGARAAGVDVFVGSPASGRTTVTITPVPERPTATVTVTAGPAPTNPGPVSLPGCAVSQGCKAFNLVVRDPGAGTAGTSITIATGVVQVGGSSDLLYQDDNGTPELFADGYGAAASVNVSSQQANEQGCKALTNSDPDPNPIVGFRKGLQFCVAVLNEGVALMTETRPPGPDDTLYLTELFWPSPNS